MGSTCAKQPQSNSTCEECIPRQYLDHRGKFQFRKIVGRGGFGKVWQVVDKKTNASYAIKIMSKAKIITKKSVNSVQNEKIILSHLNSPFIVNIVAAFQDRDNLYLLMDYLSGGDLRHYINNRYAFTEQQVKFIIRCIIQGLNYLHKNNVIHRDIKPENIIFDGNGYCRITDLGIARYWKEENHKETSGTPAYMAPQILLKQNHSFCVDYFAVGVIAYELLMGRRPYQGRDRRQIREQILAKQARIPSTENLSKECMDFVNRMVQRNSKKRLGFNGINEICSHPWLQIPKIQYMQFYYQSLKSPIALIPLHPYENSQKTELNDSERQNKLLLKDSRAQSLFNGYYFNPDMRMGDEGEKMREQERKE